MIGRTCVVIVTASLLAGSVGAEETAAPGSGEARYSFSKVKDGFLRLDTQTGEVAVCREQAVGWACLAVPEDRTVLENEIARLRKENGALKQALLSHGLPLPAGASPEAEAPKSTPDTTHPELHNPDLDRVVALIARIWRRLVEALSDAQNRVMHKS